MTTSCRAFVLGVASFCILGSAACSVTPAPVPISPSGPSCGLPAQFELSHPLSGAQGVPTSLGQVQIVADASSDVLGSTWNVVLLEKGANVYQGLILPSTSPGTFKPFPTNFYYTAPVPPLYASDVYGVYLIKTSGTCAPALVGSFTTSS